MSSGPAAGILLGLLWLLATGCIYSVGGAWESAVRVLGGSQYCGRTEPTPAVRQAGDAASYASLLTTCDLDGVTPDFEREIAILVALGERPSLGYGLEPASHVAQVRNGTAVISLAIHEPPPDAMVGQVITSPCLVLGLERAAIKAVEVRDLKGRLLGRTLVE
jgi:hypothetical protein